MHVTFYGVAITVPDVAEEKEAYNRLCRVLADAGFAFTTEEYQVDDESDWHSTSELFPEFQDE